MTNTKYIKSIALTIAAVAFIYTANAQKGSRVIPVKNVNVYEDNRPAAHYRLNAQDQGIVLKYGTGPDSCDYLGARDIWVYGHKGKYYMNYDGSGKKGWLACLATSNNIIHWKTKGVVLNYGAPGSRDARSASYGTTYFDGNK